MLLCSLVQSCSRAVVLKLRLGGGPFWASSAAVGCSSPTSRFALHKDTETPISAERSRTSLRIAVLQNKVEKEKKRGRMTELQRGSTHCIECAEGPCG